MKYNKGDKGKSEAPCRKGVSYGSSDRGAEADTNTPKHNPKISLGGSNESKGSKGQS